MKRIFAGAALVSALGCYPGGCIARGARVRTPQGLRPIESITVGDEVFCVDPELRRFVIAKVSATRSVQRECVRLVFGNSELVLTSDHPTYCPDARTYAPAGDWALGRRRHLLHATDERIVPLEVRRVDTFAGVHEVFDLTVDHPLHNFVVNGVLVHNKRIGRVCSSTDAGVVRQWDACSCGDGGQGSVQCDNGVVQCTGCTDADNDAGVDGDGGIEDAGP